MAVVSSEFKDEYVFIQEYYMKDDRQRVKRTLRFGADEIIYQEDSFTLTKGGMLYDLSEKINELGEFASNPKDNKISRRITLLEEIIAPMVKLEVKKELEAELKKLVDCLG